MSHKRKSFFSVFVCFVSLLFLPIPPKMPIPAPPTQFTIAAIQGVLRSRKLPVTGTKPILWGRLVQEAVDFPFYVLEVQMIPEGPREILLRYLQSNEANHLRRSKEIRLEEISARITIEEYRDLIQLKKGFLPHGSPKSQFEYHAHEVLRRSPITAQDRSNIPRHVLLWADLCLGRFDLEEYQRGVEGIQLMHLVDNQPIYSVFTPQLAFQLRQNKDVLFKNGILRGKLLPDHHHVRIAIMRYQPAREVSAEDISYVYDVIARSDYFNNTLEPFMQICFPQNLNAPQHLYSSYYCSLSPSSPISFFLSFSFLVENANYVIRYLVWPLSRILLQAG